MLFSFNVIRESSFPPHAKKLILFEIVDCLMSAPLSPVSMLCENVRRFCWERMEFDHVGAHVHEQVTF